MCRNFCYSAFIDLLIGNGGQTTWRVLLQIFFIFSSEGKKIIQNVQQMKYCALLTLGYVLEMLSVRIFFFFSKVKIMQDWLNNSFGWKCLFFQFLEIFLMGPFFIGPGHDKPVFPFRVAVFRLHSAHREGKLPGKVAPRLSAHGNNSCKHTVKAPWWMTVTLSQFWILCLSSTAWPSSPRERHILTQMFCTV